MLIQITREREEKGQRKIIASSEAIRDEYAVKCQNCGACCSYYAYGIRRIRADGPATEDLRLTYFGTGVLTYQWADGHKRTIREQTHWMRVKNTRSKTKWPRCAALKGAIGVNVACGIYEDRPSVCRVFEPGSEECLHIRAWAGFDKSENVTADSML